MKNIVLLALACTVFTVARAQNTPAVASGDSINTYTLPEVVVSATRSERYPGNVGRSVSVVTREFLRTSLSHSMAEALSFSEGMYLVGVGQNPGANQSIFMRGSGSNHTTFMVDDVRISDPSGVNNALDLSEFSSAGIERIEVVRGAHSTLYGSSAIGGVVHLITPKNGLPGITADAELKSGTFGEGTSLFNQHLFMNYTHAAGFYVNGEVLNASVSGMDASTDTVTNPAAYKNRDRDGLQALDLVGKVGYKNDRVDAYVSMKNHQEKKDIDQSAFVDDENYTLDFRRKLYTYGASYRFNDNWNIKFLGGYSDIRREAVDDSSVVDNAGNTDMTYYEQEWTGTTSTNELQTSIRLTAFEAVIGAGVYHETMSSKSYFFSNAFGPFELSTDLSALGLNSTTKNVFGHVDLNGYLFSKSLERLNIVLGARFNDHSSFGSAVTYEVNPSVRISDGGIAYVSYSTGFNAPSLYQLYTPESYYTSGITRGNVNLKPEVSSSFEVGIKQSLGSGVRFSLSYYHTVIDRSIEFVYLWDKDIPVENLGSDFLRDDYRGDTYLNVGKQINDGFELTVSAPLSDAFSVSANVSIVGGALEYTPANIDRVSTQDNHVQIYNNGAFLSQEFKTTELVRRPNTFNLAMIYTPVEAWYLRLDVKHAGSRIDVYYDSQRGPFGALGSVPVEEYTLVDFSQRYKFSEQFSAGVRVENMLNSSYREINGFRTRGRGIFVSLRYEVNQPF
ncbi:MAG TPA: TonB-dependent receptor [Bacteroidota bacterium]